MSAARVHRIQTVVRSALGQAVKWGWIRRTPAEHAEGLISQLLVWGLLPELPRWSRPRLIRRRAVDEVIDCAMSDFDPDTVLRSAHS